MVDDRTRLREMLADLENLLDGLREKQGVSLSRYAADDDLQDIVERRLEKATQTCIDIGQLICRLEGYPLTEATNAEVFVTLVEHDVLPASHQQAFVDIAGLRNVLAHRYRHIDPEEIYESYHNLERLERFSEEIYLHLRDDSGDNRTAT